MNEQRRPSITQEWTRKLAVRVILSKSREKEKKKKSRETAL